MAFAVLSPKKLTSRRDKGRVTQRGSSHGSVQQKAQQPVQGKPRAPPSPGSVPVPILGEVLTASQSFQDLQRPHTARQAVQVLPPKSARPSSGGAHPEPPARQPHLTAKLLSQHTSSVRRTKSSSPVRQEERSHARTERDKTSTGTVSRRASTSSLHITTEKARRRAPSAPPQDVTGSESAVRTASEQEPQAAPVKRRPSPRPAPLAGVAPLMRKLSGMQAEAASSQEDSAQAAEGGPLPQSTKGQRDLMQSLVDHMARQTSALDPDSQGIPEVVSSPQAHALTDSALARSQQLLEALRTSGLGLVEEEGSTCEEALEEALEELMAAQTSALSADPSPWQVAPTVEVPVELLRLLSQMWTELSALRNQQPSPKKGVEECQTDSLGFSRMSNASTSAGGFSSSSGHSTSATSWCSSPAMSQGSSPSSKVRQIPAGGPNRQCMGRSMPVVRRISAANPGQGRQHSGFYQASGLHTLPQTRGQTIPRQSSGTNSGWSSDKEHSASENLSASTSSIPRVPASCMTPPPPLPSQAVHASFVPPLRPQLAPILSPRFVPREMVPAYMVPGKPMRSGVGGAVPANAMAGFPGCAAQKSRSHLILKSVSVTALYGSP